MIKFIRSLWIFVLLLRFTICRGAFTPKIYIVFQLTNKLQEQKCYSFLKQPVQTCKMPSIMLHLTWNTLESSLRYPCVIFETPLRHSWDTLVTVLKNLWNTLETLKTALKHTWKTLKTPWRHPWDTVETSFRNPGDTLETPLRQISGEKFKSLL